MPHEVLSAPAEASAEDYVLAYMTRRVGLSHAFTTNAAKTTDGNTLFSVAYRWGIGDDDRSLVTTPLIMSEILTTAKIISARQIDDRIVPGETYLHLLTTPQSSDPKSDTHCLLVFGDPSALRRDLETNSRREFYAIARQLNHPASIAHSPEGKRPRPDQAARAASASL